MGGFVADAAIKQMVLAGKSPRNAKVVILGLTFKENCPDSRNSKVEDIIKRLGEYGIEPVIIDPWANERDAKLEYNIELKKLDDAHNADCIIVAVAHNEYRKMSMEDIDLLYKDDLTSNEKVLIDVKGIYKISEIQKFGYRYWRL
ncbi:UDP-glucose 6-dehydrogenase [bioreactor metagenome]|uniref:UDP-glucose 6-dehydrogenase n=1 Tax=bioreactor metagenome TaxID=1076179 RepID=A0A645HLR2_9ZZZZ